MLRREQWDGLADTLDLLIQAMDIVPDEHTTELRSSMMAIMERALSARDQLQPSRTVLNDLCDHEFPELEALIGKGIALPGVSTAEVLREVHIWLERMHHHLIGMRRDLRDALSVAGFDGSTGTRLRGSGAGDRQQARTVLVAFGGLGGLHPRPRDAGHGDRNAAS